MMNNEEPCSRLLSLSEILSNILDDSFLNFIEFISIIRIDKSIYILTEESGRK